MNILITGITGFVGSHMAKYIIYNIPNATIYASRRWRSREDTIKHFLDNKNLNLIEADLLDRSSLHNLIKVSKPDFVFHFAAQSYVTASFSNPTATLMTNTIGTSNLLEELKIARDNNICDPIIISVSSSEVYGNTNENEVSITENNPIRAANPYSISKVGHDLMSQFYFQAYNLKIIITRMFSHEGFGRAREFALSNFAYQIVTYEKLYTPSNGTVIDFVSLGKFLPIYVGNLGSIRTYIHVSDAVHAYWLAATRGKIGEIYNIGGSYSCTIGDALENLLLKSSIPRQHFDINVDPKRIRPLDIIKQIPSSKKFVEHTGWEPTLDLDDITSDLLSYWRNNL